MKLLIVSQHFFPEQFRISDLALGLKARGHSLTVLTGLPNYPKGKIYPGYRRFLPYKENWQGITIIRVPMIPRGKGSHFRLTLNYLSYAIMSSLLAPFLCRDKYDSIFIFQTSPITQALAGIVLKKLKSTPVFLWVQDLWPESLSATGKVRSPLILKWVGRFTRFIYRNCDKILIQSRAFEKNILEHGIDENKIIYYPNSCEEFYKPLSPIPSDKMLSLPEGFRVMFAGNIGAAQAIPTILDAAEKLKHQPEIKWIFVGDGSERQNLEDEIKKRDLQDHIIWVGSHPAEEMPYFFSQADIMLVTLTKQPIFALTIPSKVQSYMACAKPIVAAIDGETARVISEANAGKTVPAGDSAQLAEAVLTIYQMPLHERNQLGWNAYHYFEKHFEKHRSIEQLETCFAALTETQ